MARLTSSPTLDEKSAQALFSADQLAGELNRLGLHFLRSYPSAEQPLIPPAVLLAGLAASSEARLRLALIPLFLWRPDYGHVVRNSATRLLPRDRLTLQCYYTAAVLGQRMYAKRLQTLHIPMVPLHNQYARLLGVPVDGTPAQQLSALARRQAQLTNEPLNWLGTYHHAIQTFLRQLDNEQAWTS